MHKRRIIAASALLAPFTLAAILLFPHPKAPVISPSQVYTWDCEYPEIKPETIMLTCGDGGMYVNKIKWSRWDANGAQGTGKYNVNDCNPNCVDGTMHSAEVKVDLSRLTEKDHKFYLRAMVIQSLYGKNLPMAQANSIQWDVMEFAETMIGVEK